MLDDISFSLRPFALRAFSYSFFPLVNFLYALSSSDLNVDSCFFVESSVFLLLSIFFLAESSSFLASFNSSLASCSFSSI